MSERTWTPEQGQCLTARGGPLLVSAAAGSGKTAVLVERVVRLICEDGIGVDQLLIVTFTRAAAAEMQQRLTAALHERLRTDPGNAHLRRQMLLLPRAQVCTVDTFCRRLIDEQAHLLPELPPHPRTAEESETAPLLEDALAEVVEHACKQETEDFTALVEMLCRGKDDSALLETVRTVYNSVRKYPDFEGWLEQKLAGLSDPQQTQVYLEILLAVQETRLQRADRLIDTLERILTGTAAGPKIVESRRERVAALRQCCDSLRAGTSQKPDGGRLAQMRLKDDEKETQAVASIYADRLKVILQPVEEALAELCDAPPPPVGPLRALAGLVRELDKAFTARKLARRLVDFNDLEQLALRLLSVRGEDGTRQPSELARELSKRYRYVLVDEYQDTNALQTAIFRYVSDDEKNLFMVGDVKQSIYGFRDALPQLFMERYNRYPDYDGGAFPARIRLNRNFRSRPSVTNAVNFICRQIMTASACGIPYGKEEELYPGAVFPECPDDRPALLLTENKKADTGLSDVEAEARSVAAYIAELLHSGRTVTENGAQRPLRPGDICILLRFFANKKDTYAEALQAAGIPVTAGDSTPFFRSPEIAAVLALLHVINNPAADDVALLTVLLSPLFGFTPDDMVRLRSGDRQGNLYAAVCRCAEDDARCRAFLQTLSAWRTLAQTLSAGDLLGRLYAGWDLPAVLKNLAADGNGRRRLQALLDHATGFESNGFRGLSAYIRQLDRLQQQKGEPIRLSAAGPAEAVQLMSVHGSKGLEFPVVILAGTAGRFRRDEQQSAVQLHNELGLSMLYVDPATDATAAPLSCLAIRAKTQQEQMAEEMRLLYVAMTRAREHLCLCCTVADADKILPDLAADLGDEPALNDAFLGGSTSCAQWILAALLRHPDGQPLRDATGLPDLPILPDGQCWRILRQAPPAAAEKPAAPAADLPAADPDLCASLRARIDWRYPYTALAAVPTKCAVSHLAEQLAEAAQPPVFAIPTFGGERRLTGAERGTAYHLFMQFADLAAAAADPQAEIVRLTGQHFLSPQQAACLRPEQLQRFFASELYRRIRQGARYDREVPFTYQLPVADYPPAGAELAAAQGEFVVIQGVADAVLEEDGGLILIDFKTDRGMTDEALRDRYALQLRLYARALTEIYGKPVRQAVLFAFETGRQIGIPL